METQPLSLPITVEPATAQPVTAQPATAQPASAQPIGAQPIGAEPVGAEPIGAQPIGAEPVGAEPVGAQPVGAEPVGAEPVERDPAVPADQYRLWQIILIWASAALPMGVLTWVVAPAIIPAVPLPPGLTYWLLMILGMIWQFIVSLLIIYRELGTLRWSAVKQRTWLQTPRHPRTGQPEPKLFWWLLPALLFSALVNMGLSGTLEAAMARLVPALQPAAYMDPSRLASPEFQGQWWLLGLALLTCAFNYFLGEEFLFRGVLLPRMQGVFGRYDWLANAVLFSFYHLHKPWTLPTQLLGNLAISWPARRFRSNWLAVIVHGVEGILTLLMVLAVILG